jgi:hypothetical protein
MITSLLLFDIPADPKVGALGAGEFIILLFVLVLIGAALVGGSVFLLIRRRRKALNANAMIGEGDLIAQSPQAEPAMGIK